MWPSAGECWGHPKGTTSTPWSLGWKRSPAMVSFRRPPMPSKVLWWTWTTVECITIWTAASTTATGSTTSRLRSPKKGQPCKTFKKLVVWRCITAAFSRWKVATLPSAWQIKTATSVAMWGLFPLTKLGTSGGKITTLSGSPLPIR